MDASLQSLGVGGIFCVLVLKQVFEFLAKQRAAKQPEPPEVPSKCAKCYLTPRDLAKLEDLDTHTLKILANAEAVSNTLGRIETELMRQGRER